MILDCIVCSARHVLGDLCPLIAIHRVVFDDIVLLLLRPRLFGDARVEMIVPSFATLLANSTMQMLGNHRPLFGTILLHQFDNLLVLLVGGVNTCVEL